MQGEVRTYRSAKLSIAAGLLLLAAVLSGPAVSQEKQPHQQERSSCITCHLDADQLEENMAAGAAPAKSPLQAGVG
jgi:hypothetical protein